MRPNATRIAVALVVCLITLIVSEPARTKAISAETPITLSSIQGYTASITNYDDGVPGFCFTLTNTSSLPITGIAADLGGGEIPVTIVSQTETDPKRTFRVDGLSSVNGVRMSFALMSGDGLAPGASNTICLGLTTSLSDAELAHKLLVVFQALTVTCFDPSTFSDLALVQFTRRTTTEQCLIITNPSGGVITGVGLNFSDDSSPFDVLSITPRQQPFNQHLRFSENPGPINSLGDPPINFSLITGGQFTHGIAQNGVGPGESSSEFCISGNFPVVSETALEQLIFIRVDDRTHGCVNDCCPTTGGQTGILAGEPR